MTIAYLCGENSIWKINNIDLLKSAIAEEEKELVRHISEDHKIRGRYTVEYKIMTKEEFIELQKNGEDVLLYFKEDIRAQLKRLEKNMK